MTEIDPAKLWYQTSLDVFLNRWFSNYADARRALESEGGFLLPYQNHFFVCKPDVIQALGLDPNDPDWEKIGYDCARPSDKAAYQALFARREKIVRDAAD
jgi:hypothetical protein